MVGAVPEPEQGAGRKRVPATAAVVRRQSRSYERPVQMNRSRGPWSVVSLAAKSGTGQTLELEEAVIRWLGTVDRHRIRIANRRWGNVASGRPAQVKPQVT